ncbi:MAG: AraC family transcriptional regulator [Bacteroidales bacterium]|nr:AraC family transcriptional regulator [Bacteroidales bacterium]
MEKKDFYHNDLSMRDFEYALKSLYEQNPDRHLDQPHQLQEISDILQTATEKYGSSYENQLLQQHLNEELFFSEGSDVEIYQHLRYLPAYWHSHTFVEIAALTQGSCTNYIMDQKIEMKTGDVCIIAPDTIHAISAFSDDCVLYNFILRTSTFEKSFFSVLDNNDLLSDFFRRTLYHQNNYAYLLFRTGGDDQELINLLQKFLQESSRNRSYKDRMLNSYINILFITLLRNHSTDVISPDTDAPNDDENTILILKYLQDHFKTTSLSEIAHFFNYSERQIQRIIKSSTGLNFSQNIKKLRLTNAVRLLESTDLTIAEISEELGYSAPQNFRHAFKQTYHMTPAQYRKTHKK